jgi:hypothetical protein
MRFMLFLGFFLRKTREEFERNLGGSDAVERALVY